MHRPLFAALFNALILTGCALSPAPHVATRPAAAEPIHLAGGRLEVTRIGHASVLLRFGDKAVLTDPWFSEKPAYHHGELLGQSLEELPKLTAVVVSHGHYDHFDLDTFKAYPDKAVPLFVGPELVDQARAAGFTNVRGLAAWEQAEAEGLKFTAAPGAHGVPEVTWIIEGEGRAVYFGGDTLKIPALDEIHQRVPRLDLALLPVNGLHAMGKQVVMTADEAAALTATLKPAVVVPLHYAFRGSWFTETFILSFHGTPEQFLTAVAVAAPETRAVMLAPGELLVLAP
jgi:L-ascorbate metabolism protein UlaG (beta-lactamase superfamily)